MKVRPVGRVDYLLSMVAISAPFVLMTYSDAELEITRVQFVLLVTALLLLASSAEILVTCMRELDISGGTHRYQFVAYVVMKCILVMAVIITLLVEPSSIQNTKAQAAIDFLAKFNIAFLLYYSIIPENSADSGAWNSVKNDSVGKPSNPSAK